MSTPRRPAGLGKAGQQLWKAITGAYDLRDDEFRVLEHACRTADVLDRIDTAMADAPLTVPGSMGQLREHPLLSEGRQQRRTLAALLRQLELPESEETAAVRQVRASARGRRAARARWTA